MKKNITNIVNCVKAIGKAITTNFIAVSEIAVRNELPFFDVLGVHYEVCKREFKEIGELKPYIPFFQENKFRLTERYLDMQRNKEYIKNKFENSLN